MQLDRQSPVPFYIQIEDALRAQIESGELSAAQRGPSEIELATLFGVSRMTARKALDRPTGE